MIKLNDSVFKKSSCFVWLSLAPVIFAVGCSGSAGTPNFNPRNPLGAGPAAISLSPDGAAVAAPGDLGAAGNYVILAKTGVSKTLAAGTAIVGNIGVSPVAASYITGFSLVADATNVFSTSTFVTPGKLYASDYAVPTPSNLTTAIGNMQTAYTTAAGRTPPDYNELGTGLLGGLTLAPGLYTWSSNVSNLTGNVTISGGPNDVWIFQIAQNLNIANGSQIILGGSAQAKNIFWQVAGQVTIGTTAIFQGTILCKTAIVVNSGAAVNGRLYAQTMVTLDGNAVTQK